MYDILPPLPRCARNRYLSRLRRPSSAARFFAMSLRWPAAFSVLLFSAALATASDDLGVYARVDIAPTKTSIYIGSVSMTMPTFVRENGTYSAAYTAKVFPYFFYNEKGTLSIDVGDDELRRLERGEPVDFEGRGVNADGEERRVAGRAVPTDAHSGEIKVRVFVSKRIQLIFNTTYRFRP